MFRHQQVEQFLTDADAELLVDMPGVGLRGVLGDDELVGGSQPMTIARTAFPAPSPREPAILRALGHTSFPCECFSMLSSLMARVL